MEGTEHLGKYVYEMTLAKVEALKAAGGALPVVLEGDEAITTMDDDEDADRVEEVLVDDDDVGPEEPEEVPI